MNEPEEYWTVETITAMTGWSPGYVRKRAHEDSWRRLKTRPRKYRLADVLGSVGSHKDTRVKEHLRAKHA